MRVIKASALTLSLLAGGMINASELQDIARCRALADNNARLQCYDAIAVPYAADTVTLPAVSTAPSVAAVPAIASTVSPPVARPENFGLENKTALLVDKIESRISGSFKGWEAKSKFTLDNGQVWQVSDGSSAYFVATDPKVSIERGTWGSFFLHIEGLNKAARVKRLK